MGLCVCLCGVLPIAELQKLWGATTLTGMDTYMDENNMNINYKEGELYKK